ncbi:MAG: penicillin-binding protein 2 [Synechococcales bacterium]|nr:penicillin-binding protein 2 [Synechococcales bacterium]
MALLQNSPISHKLNHRDTGRTVGQQFQSVIGMVLITLLLVGGMASRLAYLQLIEGPRNRQLAEDNRIRLLPRPPERGRILDRTGQLLVSNRLSYSVYLWPIDNEEADWEPTIQRIANILNIPAEDIRQRLGQAGYDSPFLVRIARDITPAQLTALMEFKSELPGIQVEAETERYYPHGDLAAHVLGYTGEITDEELKRLKDDGYRLGDVIGQMGVESAFESLLRGEWGGRQVEVDGIGQVLRILGEKEALAGNDVQLTIDLDLQKAAEAALGDTKGAIVAMDPNNGGVLAMVSRPAFDPNVFSTHITSAEWERLQSLEFPFVNRAIRGYPPASTFKFVTTTAAIESGNYSPDVVLPTYPYVRAGGILFWDWNRAGFGPLGFRGAIAMSSDTFFYQTAMRMGPEPLIQWTRNYGFGSKTGIEIASEEAAGLVPDDAWKRENVGEIWYQGDTINTSIGQGFLQASPLQVAIMFAIVANGGDRVTPHLLKDNEAARTWRKSVNISPATMRVLQDGAREVITSGTGRALNDPNLPPLAGKSGTAEDPPRKSHAWFGLYGPYENPEIVVVAFAENSGGGGSKVTGPMTKQVIEAYFKLKASRSR